MLDKTASRYSPDRGWWLEGLVAVLPFLLGAVMSPLNLLAAPRARIPTWISGGWALALLIAVVVGVVSGLPRWSLPYFGVVGLNLSWIVTHRGTFMGLNTRAGLLGPLLGWVDDLVQAGLGPSTPWIIRAVCGTGLNWMALLGITACAVLIIAVLRPVRPLFCRIRGDWTLLSFALYGASAIAVSHTFEDYPPARHAFMLLSWLILAAGAWAYLRLSRSAARSSLARRALVLFAAMMAAMIVGAAGKGFIYASPNWPYPHSFTWRSEALYAVLLWVWVTLVVLSPAALRLLPQEKASAARA